MAKGNGKCTCSLPHMILGAILLTIGIWLLIGGIATQFKAATLMFDVTVVAMYFIGILFAVFGKWSMWMSHGECAKHGMAK